MQRARVPRPLQAPTYMHLQPSRTPQTSPGQACEPASRHDPGARPTHRAMWCGRHGLHLDWDASRPKRLSDTETSLNTVGPLIRIILEPQWHLCVCTDSGDHREVNACKTIYVYKASKKVRCFFFLQEMKSLAPFRWFIIGLLSPLPPCGSD